MPRPELSPCTDESDAGCRSFSFFLLVASCRNDHLCQVPRGRRHTQMSGKHYGVIVALSSLTPVKSIRKTIYGGPSESGILRTLSRPSPSQRPGNGSVPGLNASAKIVHSTFGFGRVAVVLSTKNRQSYLSVTTCSNMFEPGTSSENP